MNKRRDKSRLYGGRPVPMVLGFFTHGLQISVSGRGEGH